MTQAPSSRVWTIPNVLTILRLVATPVFIYALATDNIRLAWGILVLGGISDGLDGMLARVLNQRTRLGTLLDPLADKVLLTSSYAALAWRSWIPPWLAVLVIGRDLVIMGGLGLMRMRGLGIMTNIQPTVISKINTGMQILLLLAVLYTKSVESGLAEHIVWLHLAVAGLTMLSGVDYVLRGFKVSRSSAK